MPSGVYKRTKPVWNKGLTKYTDSRVKNSGEKTSIGKIGKKYSKSHRGNISNALKIAHKLGKLSGNGKKISKTLTGHKVSLSTRLKISKSLFRGLSDDNVLNANLRKIPEYKDWRDKVFKRDNYTCQDCGRVGGQIVAHHIKSFMIIIRMNNIKNLRQALSCKELWSIDNGKTLCDYCHEETDNYGGKIKCKKL